MAFASVRSLVEAGENIGPYISDPVRRGEALMSTAAYRLPNASAARTRERVLGAGTFGEVALESFPGAGAVAAGPRVAVKKTLDNTDYNSVIAEIAALRYFKGVPNLAQLIGVSTVAAAGNAVPTTLPRILMAPAKSSLADLLKGPTFRHSTVADLATEVSLAVEWGDLYPYTIEDSGYSPARDFAGSTNRRADAVARITAASAAAKRTMNISRPLLAHSWSNIKSICLQILRGYHAMHSWGVVHRDTKPQNMLVTHYGEVQVTDFGVSRYQTPYLDPIRDRYTGTIMYASPEILMGNWLHQTRGESHIFTQNAWKRHDAWAVGATLYHVLTRDPLFTGANAADMLTSIFSVKGCPIADDWFIFTHYTKLPNRADIQTFARDPDVIRNRIFQRSVVISPDFDPLVPDDSSELAQLAKIISGLLAYNPGRRTTVTRALEHPLFRGAPTIPPRPLISTPFEVSTLDQTGIPAESILNTENLMNVDNGLMFGVVFEKTIRRQRAPFILDRACTYFRRFYQYYSTTGRAKLLAVQSADEQLLSESYSMTVGIVAFFIAERLLNREFMIGDNGSLKDLKYIRGTTGEIKPFSVFEKIFNLFIAGDIPFLGRTYFDDLLAADAVLPTLSGAEQENRIYALGALNAYCMSGIYYRFRDDLPRLYAAMSAFATARIADLGSYFSDFYDGLLDMGTNTVLPIFVEFSESLVPAPAAAAAAIEGGRRRSSKRGRKSKRRLSKKRRCRR